MKLLIVDDDEIARISLANILGSDQVEVVQAADGLQAWELLAGGLRPMLCCTDVLMPGLDGLGLLRRCREHIVLRDLPVVLISSAADRRTVEAAIAGGIAGYILKPFLAVQTRSAVERAIRQQREARTEPVAAIRRRLDVSLERLHRMLQLLGDEIRACGERLEQDAADAAGLLPRLHGGALLLGQRRAAGLLKRACDGSLAAADRALLLREARAVVQDQLEELGVTAPLAA